MEINMKKPFLLWRDDWHLGFGCLDEQHLELANTLNKLHCFIVDVDKQQNRSKNQLPLHLSSLVDIARRHFTTEEALMRAHNYPGLAEHHREHILLLAELQECIRDIQEHSKPFTLDTLTALKHWQINHTIYSDRMFADYLNHQSQASVEDDYDGLVEVQTQLG
jgi:hemerythrin-like metal-binding protein